MGHALVLGLAAAVAACSYTGRGGPDDATTTDGPIGVVDASSDAPPGTIDGAIDAPPPDAQTSFWIEAEDFTADTISAAGHQWTAMTNVGGYSGASFVQLLPANGGACATAAQLGTCAARLEYDVTIAVAATYHVHVRTLATRNDEDSLWVGADGTPDPSPFELTEDSTWRWDTRSFALGAGPHVIDLWQREAGLRVDVLVVTTNPAPPAF